MLAIRTLSYPGYIEDYLNGQIIQAVRTVGFILLTALFFRSTQRGWKDCRQLKKPCAFGFILESFIKQTHNSIEREFA